MVQTIEGTTSGYATADKVATSQGIGDIEHGIILFYNNGLHGFNGLTLILFNHELHELHELMYLSTTD
jgi:hypothetical protein